MTDWSLFGACHRCDADAGSPCIGPGAQALKRAHSGRPGLDTTQPPAPEGEGAASALHHKETPDANAEEISVPPRDWTITAPGFVDGMPDEVYHRDPVPSGSLSHSGLKTLLDIPARFAADQEEDPEPKDHFEFGSAVHLYILGEGQRVEVFDFPSWQSNAAKDAREVARAAGHVPLLRKDDTKARRMAAAVLNHRRAGPLFMEGVPERSAFWYDEEFGFWRRARFDWMIVTPSGRVYVIDYKSTKDKVSPANLSKIMYNFGYYTQEAYYRDALRALGYEDVVFLFVVQEKDKPHLVTVTNLDEDAKAWGRLKIRQGLADYAECRERGVWPDYGDRYGDDSGIVTVGLPRWSEKTLTDEWRSGAMDV